MKNNLFTSIENTLRRALKLPVQVDWVDFDERRKRNETPQEPVEGTANEE